MSTQGLLQTAIDRKLPNPSACRFPRCSHDGCTAEVRFRQTGGYCLRHYRQHQEEVMKKFTEEQIRTAHAAHPDNATLAAKTLDMSQVGFSDRCRKLGLLRSPRPLVARRQPKVGDGQAGVPGEPEGKPSLAGPVTQAQPGSLTPATPALTSLADAGTELSRMAGLVQGFAALSPTGRAWVLERIQAA